MIYTTNVIENLNHKIRKFTKNKGNFNNEDSLARQFTYQFKIQCGKWTKT
ncbi:MAG: transposase, partial [Mycoplasma sp.]